MPASSDHDLLFGITAIELRFLTQEHLADALAGNSESTAGRTLRARLCELRLLTPAEADAVEAVMAQRVARCGGDLHKTLAAVGVPSGSTGQKPATTIDQFVTALPQAWAYSAQHQRFRVLRAHAQGGLGRLSIAQDAELNREIALKEILPVMADEAENRQRFIREAEITGALEHPGVVPVYSLGEFPDGRPYYAMRLIKGVDLRHALDDFHQRPLPRAERELQFRQLLGRFVDVCQAIHYAHSRGVIHRDIKPSNIMLGDFGETLVVDWGIAKTLDDPPTPASLDSAPVRPSDRASSTRTQAGRMVGTLPYMSPEQAAGRLDLVSPASDVYGLGATLYHILTGRAPFEGGGGDTAFHVQQGRFRRPREVARQAPKPLEAICLKAMARQRSDRYASALALATDVERYLADERVAAYAEPMTTRAWRWIRRRRTPVMSGMAAAVVAIVALAIGLGLVREQRNRAEQNFAHAQKAVRDYYVTVSEETLLNQLGMQPLRDALLRQALDYYEQFLAERQDDSALRGDVAEAQFLVGRITETVDSPAAALPHYQEAARLETELLAGDAGNAALSADHAQTLNALGRVLQKLERLDEAGEYYKQAAAIRERLAEIAPDDAERARELASSVMNQGVLHMAAGRPEEALPLLERAQQLRLVHIPAGASAEDATLQRDIGMGYYNLALVRLALGETDVAEERLTEAIAAFVELARREPQDFDARRRLGLCRRMLGDVLASRGDLDEAVVQYELARDALVPLVERNPDVPDYAADLAGVRMNLGAQRQGQGDLAAALEEMESAAELLRAIAAGEAPTPRYRRDLGVALRAAGQILMEVDRTDDARERLSESRTTFEQLVAEFPADESYASELELTQSVIAELDSI